MSSGNKEVSWESEIDPNPWYADSQIPASEQISELPGQTDLPTQVPEPAPVEEPEDPDAAPVRRRSKTIARKQMLRERRRLIAQGALPEILEYDRPSTRDECREEKRPCLYVSCRYHLYLDVNPITGSIKINFPDLEPWQLADTCALDVAERGGITLEEVGEIMNLTRERIRQVEVSGLDKLRDGEAPLETFLDGRELKDLPHPHDALPIVEDE